MLLCEGQFSVSHAGESNENDLTGRKRKLLRSILSFNEHQISDLAIWLTVERCPQRNAIMHRHAITSWKAPSTQEKVEGEHLLQSLDSPIALL